MAPIELHRENGLARERGEGGDQFETQRLLLRIYKREGRAEIERDVVTCMVYLLLFAFYLNSSKKDKVLSPITWV